MNKRISTLALFIGTALAASTLVGCGAPDGSTGSASTGEAPSEPGAAAPSVDPGSTSSNVLYSMTAKGHDIQFIEIEPGVGAIIEKAAMGEAPLIDTSRDVSIVDAYRALDASPVPRVLVDAQKRREAWVPVAGAAAPIVAPTQAENKGPAYYDDGQQAWFFDTFCNGAEACAQWWNGAHLSTQRTRAQFIGMVGSESPSNDNRMTIQYWKPQPTVLGIPIACGWGVECGWIEFVNVVCLPGNWVSVTVWNAPGFYGHVVAPNAQVSLAVRR